MADYNQLLVMKLATLADDLQTEFFDLRDLLPEHATKSYSGRDPAMLLGACYHHSASVPTPRENWYPNQDVAEAIGCTESRIKSAKWLRYVWRCAEYHTGPSSHLAEGGAPGIAYTIVVDPDGGTYLCHNLEAKTWAQGSGNSTHVAVLFPGNNYSQWNQEGLCPTPMQIAMGALLWEKVFWPIFPGWKPENFSLHNRFGKAACPGDHLSSVVDCINQIEKDSALDGWRKKQEALNLAGAVPQLVVDGVFGSLTKAAVVDFQRAFGLVDDGIWGPSTEHAMQVFLDSLK